MSLQYLLNNNMIDKQEIETKLPLAFYQLHKLTTKLLRDNDILHPEEEKKDDDRQLQLIVATVMKLLSILIRDKLWSSEDVKRVISEMKQPE